MESYLSAVAQALQGVLDLVVRLALPLAIVVALLLLTPVLARRPLRAPDRRLTSLLIGYALVGLATVALWAALRDAGPRARQELAWRESTEATTNPVPDAPPVLQYAPALAALTERTYTRRLTLPPEFFQRIGAEGLGVLAPYLTDPSADDILRLVDTFRRSGRDVVFTREATRLDEEPIPFDASSIHVRFERLGGRAYDLQFEGRYTFRNAGNQPITARLVFPLPEGGTVRDLKVQVGDTELIQPDEAGTYQWKSALAAGERREAIVRYRVTGSRTWQYDLGSRRRRVQQFTLEADTGGPVRFVRGSLHPTDSAHRPLRWSLTNVVTAQQIALSFPPDVAGRDGYLQALTALPAALIALLVGVLALGWTRPADRPSPGALLAGLTLFGLGLGASSVLAGYVGPIAAILIGPLMGAALARRPLGGASLRASIPAALLPAAFLSPQHSGLLVVALALLTLAPVSRPAATSD